MLRLIQTVRAALGRRRLPPLPTYAAPAGEVPNLIYNVRWGLTSSTRFLNPLGRHNHPIGLTRPGK